MIFGALISFALGIFSIMILFSLTATALQEAIAQLLNTRGKRLRDGIIVLLQKNFPEEIDPRRSMAFFYDEFYRAADLGSLTTRTPDNGFLKGWEGFKLKLRGGVKKLPSAIEPRRYAEALFHLIGSQTERNAMALEAKSLVEKGEKQLLEVLKGVSDARTDTDAAAKPSTAEPAAASVAVVSDEIQATITRAQSMVDARLQELEEEFNETMDRVSGWYTRQAKMTLFVIGLLLAVGANIDLIRYAERLLTDENLRNKADIYAQLLGDSGANQAQLAAADDGGAGNLSEASDERISPTNLQEMLGELQRLDVQIGWCEPIAQAKAAGQPPAPVDPATAGGAIGPCQVGEQLRWPPTPSQVVGWFLIAIGVTLGSQFWFNLLKKLLNLRTSGRLRSSSAQTPQGAT